MQLLILFAACGSGDKGADVASDDTAVVDADDDGFLARVDCDDGDAAVHPGADDVPGDGVDQDCADGDALADGDSGGDPGDDT
ncbi:MAG: MopE-related protein, partial [Myxococcota bacterium]